MGNDVPGVKEAQYRLLGIQAVPFADGVVIRRGRVRIFLRGEGLGDLLDLIVRRSAEGNGVSLAGLLAGTQLTRHSELKALFSRLVAERLLVPADSASGDERPEDIFYWNHGASAVVGRENLARVEFAVFGVNHIALPLLGNLRSCGFRAVTLVDHPALRNLDFFNDRQELRPEIAAAMATPPRSLDDWTAKAKPADCHVVCSDFGGLDLMREWNRRCVATGTRFYPIVLEDEVASLGPLVVPGEGPCYECLVARADSNLAEPERARATEAHAFFGQDVTGFVQPMARVAADLAAVDLLKYFSRTLPGGVAGRLIEADLMTPALRTRTLLRAPRCPVCAPARVEAVAPAGNPGGEV
ncbi:MAG TPA: TOMM precursor leader peptide-binding protein [Bauldia sp.]|nr:TOMM precursor leader peptide-binding protein [Bauldia sp.]